MTAIAVVGMGGVFAGSPDLERFWQAVRDGSDMSSDATADRWGLDPESILQPWPPAPDRVYALRGYYIHDFKLDGSNLDLEPSLIRGLDLSSQMLLHAGRQAFESSATSGLDRSKAGVILGQIALPTAAATSLALGIMGPRIDRFWPNGSPNIAPAGAPYAAINHRVTGLPASLLSRALNLSAGSFTLDAACSSSLYAVKLACDELLSGRSDLMLAGGMARPDSLYTQMGFCQLRALSAGGRCSPFDHRGDGLVVGEGAGVVALKRLDDALKAGDRVYGVIRGWGLSNDLEGSLLAPAREGQLRAMKAAYQMAGWDPSDVDLIECHATGTPVGDRVEFGSLKTLWEGIAQKSRRVVLGSVKSTVGHLLTGAGAASLIKTLLAIHHRTLPPTANFERPHPDMGLEESPFQVLTEAIPWEKTIGPRRAAVSGFGFGGTNGHLLVEEWAENSGAHPVLVTVDPLPPEPVAVVGLAASAGPWASLDDLARRWFSDADDTQPESRLNWWGPDERLPRGYYQPSVEAPIGRFRIPPAEMKDMLPQQIRMLLTAADALADANYEPSPERTAGTFIGLALDPNTTNYHFRWSLENKAREWAGQNDVGRPRDVFVQGVKDAAGPPITADRTLGALGSIVASRISREFRMAGPGFTVSSDEHSGLTALELAWRALQAGEIDLALVGAVDFTGDARTLLADGGPPSHDPVYPAEGAGALVLKRLADAQRDGDRIYGVVGGVGRRNGSNAPADNKTAALENACREAGISVSKIDFLETAGRKDPASMLPELPHDPAQAEGPPPIWGSAGFRTGHAGAADGLLSLVRTIYAIKNRCLPASPAHGPSATAQARQTGPGYWLKNRQDGPRIAAVTSVNQDGAAMSVIIHEDTSADGRRPVVEVAPPPGDQYALYVAAADDTPGLLDGLKALETNISDQKVSLAGDPGGRLAVAMIARDRDELKDLARRAATGLENGVDRIEEERLFHESRPLGAAGELAFVFPGSGNHFPGMGLDISAAWPQVFDRLDRDNQHLRDQFAADYFWRDGGVDLDHRALISGQVAVGTAVHDVVTAYGIKPQAVIGHSLGETASLFATGTWTARDVLLHRSRNSTLFTHELAGECRAARAVWDLPANQPVAWLTGLVNDSADRIRDVLADYPKAYLQIVNAPKECMIGGDASSVRDLVNRLGCLFIPVEGVTTVHCEAVQPVRQAYYDLHLFPTTPPDHIRVYSAAWGKSYRPDRESAARSITDQALNTMDFPRLIQQAHDDGVRLFLEMGPGGSCTRMISRILDGKPHGARPVYLPGRDVRLSVWQALAWGFAHRAVTEPPSWAAAGGTDGLEIPRKGPTITISTERKDIKPPDIPRKNDLPAAQPLPEPTTPAERVAPPAPETPAVGAPPPERLSMQPVIQGLADSRQAEAEAHRVFLRMSEKANQLVMDHLAFQMKLTERVMTGDIPVENGPKPLYPATPVTAPAPTPAPAPPRPAPFMDRPQCLEFAVGSIGAVLGERFADIDRYPTRVRLPDEPLMLVDRIMSVEGEALSLKVGRVVTEHDVLADGWYLDGERIPACIAIEAGQADLFLSGYLGIDFKTKGLAVYRLLDAEVTFQGPLPGPGDIISYDIRIERFFRHGETYLFRFQFDATVDGRPLMIMRNGCAGFFSPAELSSGKGLLASDLDVAAEKRSLPPDWPRLVQTKAMSLGDDQLAALYQGDLAAVFGEAFGRLALTDPITLPQGRMGLIDRVLHLDPQGGRYGLGVIKTEMDIHPDDWFLTCHFVDDMVMPGTLMYECCLHSLRLFLLSLGWVGDKGRVAHEPLPGVTSKLKCRGQITQFSRKAAYEIFIKALGFGPEPYAIADGIMYADGRPVVNVEDMTVKLTGMTRDELVRLWDHNRSPEAMPRAVFTREQVLTFAEGNPSQAFGAPYQPFDRDRFIARLPRPPYSFIDQIVRIENAEAFRMKAGALAVAEYTPTGDEWYFTDNRGSMPYAVLLEIALQPCGWMSAYSGSALYSEKDLHFRNLGGTAVQHAPVPPHTGRLTTEATLTKVSRSGDMIIQHYDFRVSSSTGCIYEGNTYFGFFSEQSLANQLGIQGDAGPRIADGETSDGPAVPFPKTPSLPQGMILMMDDITHLALDGGAQGLGAIRGQKRVNPAEWFFQAHFHQDPVWPGSLGVEAFLQLLQVLAARRWNLDDTARFQAAAPGIHHEWIYRGQVTPSNREVTVEAIVSDIDDREQTIKADGTLSVDGMTIYQMKGLSVKAV